MEQRNSEFFIKKENFDKALVAIKALANETKKMSGESSNGEHWFSWVDDYEFVEAKTLAEALTAWRWEPQLDEDGNINDIFFNGEKLGDDFVLFEEIAPFVKENSFIEMNGEDGTIWRWVFTDGICCKIPATISFG